MCRFKLGGLFKLWLTKKFQYILCVGSSLSKFIISLVSLVSIHPMCRFKYRSVLIALWLNMFQYILCVGSRVVKDITIVGKD